MIRNVNVGHSSQKSHLDFFFSRRVQLAKKIDSFLTFFNERLISEKISLIKKIYLPDISFAIFFEVCQDITDCFHVLVKLFIGVGRFKLIL